MEEKREKEGREGENEKGRQKDINDIRNFFCERERKKKWEDMKNKLKGVFAKGGKKTV